MRKTEIVSPTCEQKPIGKKQHIYERKHIKPKWPTSFHQGVRGTRTQALENVRLSSPLSSKNLNTLGQNTVLSRGGRRKLFNPDLMNKLIRME